MLQTLPINGSIFDSLWSYNDVDDSNDANNTESIDLFTDDGSLELGPTPGTTGPSSDEKNIYMTESFACINSSYCNEINQNKIISILK